jgi:hypothetical protein
MSHVAKIAIEIKDLDALQAACARIGCELINGKTTYRWFGRHVGDYPLPEGFAATDLGQCEHAIRVPDASYEIGVVRRRDGKSGYTLLWDFFSSGGLDRNKAIGPNAGRLVQAYGVESAKRAARRAGYSVTEADGSATLKVKAP